jgi:hypothetical protein
MPPICLPPVSASKKSTGQYSAAHAALGGRTLKTGQSRCFVGYKKHTLRLWLHQYPVGVQLLPLVSWVTPANVSEGGLLAPSLHYCQRQWDWCPPLVVADMGYLGSRAKQQCREQWSVSVLTKLRSDMKLVAPYVAWNQAACPQGEPLTWLVRRWSRTGTLPLLLGSGTLPASICTFARAARNVAGSLAAGQSGGATGIATSATLDWTGTIVWEEPTRLGRRVFQQSEIYLGDGVAGERRCAIASTSVVGSPDSAPAACGLDAASAFAGSGGEYHNTALTHAKRKSAKSPVKPNFYTLAFVTPSVNGFLTTLSESLCLEGYFSPNQKTRYCLMGGWLW